MLNKIIFQILLLSSVGCTYNPDAGEFVKFSPLSSTNSNTIVLDQFSFTGTSISTIYKESWFDKYNEPSLKTNPPQIPPGETVGPTIVTLHSVSI